MQTRVKTPKEIESMRIAGKWLAEVLQHVKAQALAGMTTKDLSDIAAAKLKTLGGEPSFLGYQGFPDVLCVSVNDEVVHGIPNHYKGINNGDVIGIDFGVTYQGMITDAAISFILGDKAPERVHQLISTTEQALMAGIETIKAGARVGDIASAIQKVLDKQKLGIIRDLVGHGVGHELHEDPNFPNYGHVGSGPILQAGMTVALEPMATLGSWKVKIDPDGWTIRTQDGSLAAHFEHTVLVTDKGYEILTKI